MANQTVLYTKHLESNAKMVDFYGWDMPLNYGSQIEEHKAVREDAGMFDVSHMTVVDVTGDDAKAFLQKLLANDVAKLTVTGKALYGGMLNHDGGVIDDLITYYLNDTHYRIVVNSATRVKDLAWINEQSQDFAVEIAERPELAMIAVQGPNAKAKAGSVFNDNQKQAVEGMKMGAFDYLMKPADFDDLTIKLEAARKRKDEQEERIRKAESKLLLRKSGGIF